MDGLMPISSRDNQYLKLARSLSSAKARRESGCFLLEGIRLAEEALNTSWPLAYALLSDAVLEQPRVAALIERLAECQVPLYVAPDNMLQQASATEHSQGLLLIAYLPDCRGDRPRLPELPPHADFLLLADRLSDPGNLGAIMRSAWAAGVDALLLTPGSADPYSPKVARASMGAVLRLPVLRFSDEQHMLALLQERGFCLYATAADGACRYDKADLTQPLVWLLGAEASGLSQFWREAASQSVYLPMAQGAESLNVAATTAVLLYATAAQRGFPKA